MKKVWGDQSVWVSQDVGGELKLIALRSGRKSVPPKEVEIAKMVKSGNQWVLVMGEFSAEKLSTPTKISDSLEEAISKLWTSRYDIIERFF